MWIVLCLIFILLKISACANILYMSILPSPSHHIWNGAIVNELAARGHNVTVISPFSVRNPTPNAHYIDLNHEFEVTQNFMNAAINANGTENPFYITFVFQEALGDLCGGKFELINQFYPLSASSMCTFSKAVKTEGFQTLINYPDNFKFDLVVNDLSVGSCFLPFVHKFNYPPLISVTAYGHPAFLIDLVGGHHYHAYVPHETLPFNEQMTFSERLHNFLIYNWDQFFVLTPRLNAIVAESFGPNLPPIRVLEHRTALAFINTNPVMDYSVPLLENVIPVAGVHIKPPKPLPKDLEEFIVSSKKGTVVFSLGTNLLSKNLPVSKRNVFFNVFKSLPEYHFLWKFETNDILTDLPKNVRIESWLPQSDVIAHPKVRAIFFHGGMLTTQEALWRGVPMIIMPFVLDQHQNLIKTKRLGVSEGVDYLNLNATQVRETLIKVLEDPSYSLNATKWSQRFQDQKETPLERAIWWIEWLLRNPNSDYLKSPVLGLGFFAGNAYDIITFFMLIILLLVFVLLKSIHFCVRKCAEKITVSEHHKAEKVE